MPNAQPHIVIVGAGRIGQAIAQLIRRGQSHANVELWDVRPDVVPNQQSLDVTVPAADVVFFCVPSWTLREAVMSIKSSIRPETAAVTLTKGLERTTHKLAQEIIAEVLGPDHPYAALTGPLMAEDLNAGQSGIAMVASLNPHITGIIASLFDGTAVEVVSTTDVMGAAWSSVMKNVYSLAIGIADGLQWPAADHDRLLDMAKKEMLLVSDELGISAETVQGPAGYGDFVMTATSPHSRNRGAGEEFITKGKDAPDNEAMSTLPEFIARIGEQHPILKALADTIIRRQDARTTFGHLIA